MFVYLILHKIERDKEEGKERKRRIEIEIKEEKEEREKRERESSRHFVLKFYYGWRHATYN